MRPKTNPLTAVLLAGGLSRRMGRDKAFLEIEGRPLWQVQVAKLAQVADEILISVRDVHSAIESEYRKIPDPPGARGPLGGIASALRTATHSHLLVLAVDLPAMTPAYLQTLATPLTPGVGIVPELDGFYQGTCAIYPASLLPLVEEILRGDDPSFQNLIRTATRLGAMKTRPVPPEESPLFANWNTPGAISDGTDSR